MKIKRGIIMDIINNILDNKIQIQIDDRIIDVNDIEKVERKLFLFKKFRLNIKLKTGEVIQKLWKIYNRSWVWFFWEIKKGKI